MNKTGTICFYLSIISTHILCICISLYINNIFFYLSMRGWSEKIRNQDKMNKSETRFLALHNPLNRDTLSIISPTNNHIT